MLFFLNMFTRFTLSIALAYASCGSMTLRFTRSVKLSFIRHIP